MFKDKYKELMDSNKPSEELINRTVKLAKETKQTTSKKTKNKHLRPILIGLCLILCTTVAYPALAATVKRIYELMYLAPPSVAETFTPVEISHESNGIKLEVVAIDISGNTAKVYFTLQDLIGNRIDKTIDLKDSYNIEGVGTAVCGCEFYGYEEDLKKATFMITITDLDSNDISKSITDNLTFTLKQFSHENQKYGFDESFKIPVNLEDIISDLNGTQEVRANGAGGDYEKYTGRKIFDEKAEAIIQNIAPVSAGIKGFNIIGAGYKDDKLHLQVEVSTGNILDDCGYLYLRKKGDTKDIICLYNISFSNYEYMPKEDDELFPLRYEEEIFDIPKDELSNYELYGYFNKEGQVIEGNWKVSFPLDFEISNASIY